MKRLSLATVFACAAISVMAAPPEPINPDKLPPASTQEGLSFEKDIHPIFETACVHCHGEKEAKHELRLDTLDGVMKGAKEHKMVVPGHSDQSRLVYAVADIDGKTYMPPKPRGPRPGAGPGPGPDGGTNAMTPGASSPGPMGPPPGRMHPWKPLTPEQVGLIRAWIDQGAKP
ncbi:MAG TPA: c-type cytochrome domain-containing protein [Verrucomicrobiae bacterium]|jgi:hypothetical protein|nr:c-type cytochrome domain-containing protein [Verrucomicrobiae bacterium]